MLASLTRSFLPAVRRSVLPMASRGARSFSSVVFTKEHEWISPGADDDHVATVGITNFAQDQIGELVYVDLPTVGSVFHKDEVLCTLESVKSVEEVLCPVAAAEVLETNVKVEDTPDLVNLDPEHDGWLVRIHYEGDVEADGKNFFSEEEYRKGHSVEVFE